MLEWRRPSIVYGRIDFFLLHYRAEQGTREYMRRIDVAVGNYSDLYVVTSITIVYTVYIITIQATITMLVNYTTYNIAVSAVTKSRVYPGTIV